MRSTEVCGVVVRAAAASAGGDDPYKVLGLTRGANSDAVNRAYKRMITEARGNDAEKAKIENAHSSIMMFQLSARMKGGVEVAKDIRFADKAVYFPWRPRRHNADQKIILYTAVAYAVMAAWSIFTQTTAGTQPLIASTIIGGASNVYKLQQIFPPGPSESGNSSGIKNLLRGALLAVAATFLGCFLIFTLPDWTAAQLNKQLPYFFYENEQTLLTIGTAISNWVMSSFFR
ncbi:g8510 [Coccomyxa viridis]|uniref:G8510 protein n=1 Tax=Coccomyxa viridis TaxID=1274662 RepID=A0ABP1G4Z5_9CHLO